jgi:hypothetical protein
VSKTAIVTLAIGQNYSERFELLCRKNWSAYAERHGFDIVVIKEPLDLSDRARRRSPAWQKCLVLGLKDLATYERVVWVDSDIVINPNAPSIVENVPIEKIGATDENRYPTAEVRQSLLRQVLACAPDGGEWGKRFWESWLTPGAFHAHFGLPSGQAHIVQTGVLVLSPKHHRDLLQHVYDAYDDGGINLNYEMRPLSHEIQARGLQHWMDPRFNALIWWLYLERAPTDAALPTFLRNSYAANYFLHFAGAAHLMSMLGSLAG